MTVCAVCGGSEFNLLDGCYYCSECNAIVQNVGQQQEEEEEYREHFFSQLSITSSAKKRKKEGKDEQTGEKWCTHECFNVIIFKQVEKLIKLGASPQLKIVVFYLWAKYLKKCEVAFTGNETDGNWLPRLGSAPQRRDIIILYEGETKLPNTYNRRKNKDERYSEDKIEDAEEIGLESEVKASQELFSEPEIFPGLQDKTESDIPEDVDKSVVEVTNRNRRRKLEFNTEAQKIQDNSTKKSTKKRQKDNSTKKCTKKQRKVINYNDYMSIEKTAAFCYLGLLLTRDEILLCDLIRWARENHFPYISVSYLLPPTMKLQSNDWRFITSYKLPELKTINEVACKLAVFLEVDLPKKSLMPIIARFVIDFNLPNEILPITHKMINNKLTLTEWKTVGIPKYELIAMSIIIITLKMLFGLNDDVERKLSIIGRELTECLPKEFHPFIWEDWKKSTMQKLNFISHTHAPSAIFDETELFNVNCQKTFYEETICSHWHPKETVLSQNYNTSEFRDSLRKVFSGLNEIDSSTPMCPATSFPITSLTKYYLNMNMADTKLYSEDFSNHSLTYITNWEKYLQDPKTCDIYNYHLGTSALFNNCDSQFECSLAQNQYWILHMSKTDPVDIPYKSFMWLLSVCSKYVEVFPEELYFELIKIENIILKDYVQQKRLPQNNMTKMGNASSIRKRPKRVIYPS